MYMRICTYLRLSPEVGKYPNRVDRRGIRNGKEQVSLFLPALHACVQVLADPNQLFPPQPFLRGQNHEMDDAWHCPQDSIWLPSKVVPTSSIGRSSRFPVVFVQAGPLSLTPPIVQGQQHWDHPEALATLT